MTITDHVTSMCWSCDLRCPSVRAECTHCTSEETEQGPNQTPERDTGECSAAGISLVRTPSGEKSVLISEMS